MVTIASPLRWLAAVMLALVAITDIARAQAASIAADQAFEQARQGELIIVDVRTPGEWRQSGVAEGAVPLDLRDPEFGSKLQALRRQNPDTPLAMICARGNRSTMVADRLMALGVTDVRNVSEGMFGSSSGPGWLGRGLPVEQP
jgi:rhodanese-related sulfurtransferase